MQSNFTRDLIYPITNIFMMHFILCVGDLSDFYTRHLVIHWTNNQSTNLQLHNIYYVLRRIVFQEVDWCYTDQTSVSWLHIIVSKSKIMNSNMQV